MAKKMKKLQDGHINQFRKVGKAAYDTSRVIGGMTKQLSTIDIPFGKEILERARVIADKHEILIIPHERLGWVGSSFEMPHVFADGKTEDVCKIKIREALVFAVVTMLELGMDGYMIAKKD